MSQDFTFHFGRHGGRALEHPFERFMKPEGTGFSFCLIPGDSQASTRTQKEKKKLGKFVSQDSEVVLRGNSCEPKILLSREARGLNSGMDEKRFMKHAGTGSSF